MWTQLAECIEGTFQVTAGAAARGEQDPPDAAASVHIAPNAVLSNGVTARSKRRRFWANYVF